MADRILPAIVRIPIWLAQSANCSLPFIVSLYSVTHILLLVILSWCCYKTGGKKYFEVAALAYFLVVGHSYFWCVSENIPALFGVVITAAVLDRSTRSISGLVGWDGLLYGALLIALQWTHPQSITLIYFLIIFLFIERRTGHRWLVSALLPALLIQAIKTVGFPNWYDAIKMEGLMAHISQYGFNFTSIPSFKVLSFWLLSEWWALLAFALFILFQMLRTKRFKLFAWILLFTLGYLLLFVYTNDDQLTKAYAEASLYGIAFVFSYAYYLGDDRLKSMRKSYFVVAIACLAIIRIWLLSDEYSQRLAYIKDFESRLTTSKTVVSADSSMSGYLNWGLPFETAILSALKGRSTTRTAVYDNHAYKKYTERKDVLWNGMGGVIELRENAYFHFDSTRYAYETK